MVVDFFYDDTSPQCDAVRMVLENLGINYRTILNNCDGRSKNDAPEIRDGNVVLTESRAIAIYLCNKYETKDKMKNLCPNNDVDTIARFNSILFRDVDNLNNMNIFLNSSKGGTKLLNAPNPELLPKALTILKEIDDMVANNEYVFGDHLTILDFFLFQTVSDAGRGGVEVWKKFKNLRRWKKALRKTQGSTKYKIESKL